MIKDGTCLVWALTQDGRGTFEAHHFEICPEVMRTAEISTADQSAC
jgi:hypothetical protein